MGAPSVEMRRFGYVGPYAFFIFRKKGNYTPKTAAPSCLACGVSVGSIYNYFDSKAALLSETVGSVWQEIFHRPDDTDVLFSQMLSALLRQTMTPVACWKSFAERSRNCLASSAAGGASAIFPPPSPAPERNTTPSEWCFFLERAEARTGHALLMRVTCTDTRTSPRSGGF